MCSGESRGGFTLNSIVPIFCVNVLLIKRAKIYVSFFHTHYCFGTWCHLVNGDALEGNRQRCTQPCNMLKTEMQCRSSQLYRGAEGQPVMIHASLSLKCRSKFSDILNLCLCFWTCLCTLNPCRERGHPSEALLNCSDYRGQIRKNNNYYLHATCSRASSWKYFTWQESQSHGKVTLMELDQNDSV